MKDQTGNQQNFTFSLISNLSKSQKDNGLIPLTYIWDADLKLNCSENDCSMMDILCTIYLVALKSNLTPGFRLFCQNIRVYSGFWHWVLYYIHYTVYNYYIILPFSHTENTNEMLIIP